MPVVECPQCTNRVLDTRGTCPSCGGDLTAKRPKSKHVRTSIDDVERLPSLCCRCGEATDRTMWLGASRRIGGESWPMRVLYYLGLAIAAVFLTGLLVRVAARGALGSGAGTRMSARRKVPVCKACKRRDPPVLEHVDLERLELTFSAHRAFARALADLRGQRTTEDDARGGPYRRGFE